MIYWACLAARAASLAPDGDVSEACVREYEEKADVWRSMSNAQSVYVPVAHRPEAFWEKLDVAQDLEVDHFEGYEFSWLSYLFEKALQEVRGCAIHEGKYWEVVLHLRKLYDLILPGARRARYLHALSNMARSYRHLSVHEREELPEIMRVSICVPQSCDRSSVAKAIFPRSVLPKLLGVRRPLQDLLGNASSSLADVLDVEEMLDWSAFKLDFVIGGVDGCGTTSLHLNLNKHPQVIFGHTASDADGFFINRLANRILPLRSQVEEYNAAVESAKEAKWKATGIWPLVVGSDMPTMFNTLLALLKISCMPDVKLVMIFCDPLGRLEKWFYNYHYCPQTQRHLCFSSTSALVSERFGQLADFWESRRVATHVPTAFHLFKDRVQVLHQLELRDPFGTFGAVAQFLGVEAFAQHEIFQRFNSQAGHRTDLCRNGTTQKALQRLLRAEYQFQERIFRELPLRRTRCDGDLGKTSCPGRVACE